MGAELEGHWLGAQSLTLPCLGLYEGCGRQMRCLSVEREEHSRCVERKEEAHTPESDRGREYDFDYLQFP